MYKKIMVPLDGSELAECVLPHVEAFITSFRVTTLVFVRVVEPAQIDHRGPYMTIKLSVDKIKELSKRIDEERIARAEEYLKQVVSRVEKDGVKIETEVFIGNVAGRLVGYSESNDIDLILIATHGRSGATRWTQGSIADRILRASHVPVLMVRAPVPANESKE